jgi:hypothetical protein
MSTTFKIKEQVTLDTIKAIKTQQSRELLTYLFNKYGHSEVDQNQLMLELNIHQTDGKVLSQGSSGPISRTYEFYRKNSKSGWWNAGLVEITKTNKSSSKDEYIKYLEDLLEQNEVEFEKQ